jgi:hypothetical protein
VSTRTIRRECLDCGLVASAEELRRHAEVTGCRTFRRTTLVVSPEGKFVDKLIEVYQLPAWVRRSHNRRLSHAKSSG